MFWKGILIYTMFYMFYPQSASIHLYTCVCVYMVYRTIYTQHATMIHGIKLRNIRPILSLSSHQVLSNMQAESCMYAVHDSLSGRLSGMNEKHAFRQCGNNCETIYTTYLYCRICGMQSIYTVCVHPQICMQCIESRKLKTRAILSSPHKTNLAGHFSCRSDPIVTNKCEICDVHGKIQKTYNVRRMSHIR